MIAALLLAAALQTAAAAPASPSAPAPEATDFVCTATDDSGQKQAVRYSVDYRASAWCEREAACKEIKTLFGLKGSKVILESSQLEVTSYETSIDRGSGAYDSVVTLAEPPIRSESHGVCKAVPFTPFGVAVSGAALKP